MLASTLTETMTATRTKMSSPYMQQDSVALAFAVASLQRQQTENDVVKAIFKPVSVPDTTEQSLSPDTSLEVVKDETTSRLARSRDRNREHARRTRLRKKAQMAALQTKITALEQDRSKLHQGIEECQVASILLGFQSKEQAATSDTTPELLMPLSSEDFADKANDSSQVVSGKRKRFLSKGGAKPTPLKLMIDGEVLAVGGGKSHINWKTGVCNDLTGASKQLTQEQLEILRRERNRMHAKMTRDRKKCFIATMEKHVTDLEADVQRMRNVLSCQANQVTPLASPELTPVAGPQLPGETDDDDDDEKDTLSVYSEVVDGITAAECDDVSVPALKKARPGFSLDD